MKLVIHGQYGELHRQHLTVHQYGRLVDYCNENFETLGYESSQVAMDYILRDAWAQSAKLEEKLSPDSMSLFVYPTEGDYKLPAESFCEIPLCHVINKNRLYPDFVISGHLWAEDDEDDPKVPELLLLRSDGSLIDINKKSIRVLRKTLALKPKRYTETYQHSTYWDRAQVSYVFPCEEDDFRLTKLKIEIVNVGAPDHSILQRVWYGRQLITYDSNAAQMRPSTVHTYHGPSLPFLWRWPTH